MTTPQLTLVIDIGKTHAKVHLLNSANQPIYQQETKNRVLDIKPYRHFDIDGLWSWLNDSISSIDNQNRSNIQSICITTHGAAAALINRHTGQLTLPILDYEDTRPESLNEQYNQLRPDYTETLSPNLPMGLNLGRQLFWLEKSFPDAFADTTDILLLPQYWAWRLTGVTSSECTSLGCHTDLWDMQQGRLSSLVTKCGWADRFPARVNAWDSLGTVKESIASLWGLASTTQVHAGIHDSNASYLRYLKAAKGSFALISSGTWTIAMSSDTPIQNLDEKRDMLANCDALGRPLACSRFMGGREYGLICEALDAPLSSPQTLEELQTAIDSQAMAIPSFVPGCGPCGSQQSEIKGGTSENAAAIATLYCALMIDLQLDTLEAKDQLFIEGSFLKNPLLLQTLAQLRSPQILQVAESSFGTVEGCALLGRWHENNEDEINREGNEHSETTGLATYLCQAASLQHLAEYKQFWHNKLAV